MTVGVPLRLSAYRMSWYQYLVVWLCVAISIADGWDTVSISLTAPLMAKDMSITHAQLGLVFGAGAAGLLSGALLGWLADLFGRRAVTISASLLVGAAMLATPLVTTVEMLVVARFLTGLCVGVLTPCLNILVVEFSSAKRGNMLLGVLHVGLPLGIVLGSTAAAAFVPTMGWHIVYWIGGSANILLGLAGYLLLPESFEYLIERRPPRALEKLNELARRCGLPRYDELPPVDHALLSQRIGLRGLFRSIYLVPVLVLGSASACHQFASYFKQTWTPSILIDSGMTHQLAFVGAAVTGVAGAAGNLLAGLAGTFFDPRRLALAVYLLNGLAFLLFAAVSNNPLLLVGAAGLLAFISAAANSVSFMVFVRYFPVVVRGTCMGAVVACGRMGAVFGPMVGGVLMGLGWQRASYLPIFAFAAALGAIPFLAVLVSQRLRDPEAWSARQASA